MINERKRKILNIIIKEHIKTAAPVGSKAVAEKYKLNISPATIRNEMAELEEEGYIIQPHTSAGRIPTAKAYNLYLENLKLKEISKKNRELIDSVLKNLNEEDFKEAAKILANLSGNAVFWAFHKNNLYYTGISNVLTQPEFIRKDLIYNISSIIDRLDEIIDNIFEEIENGLHIFVGPGNPFGSFCSSILVKYRRKKQEGMFGVIGPLRMDYEKIISLANYVFKKINNSK